MRAAGVVDSARGLAPLDHLCWGFADRAEFHARAAEFLADGLAAGQLVVFVGDGDSDSLAAELGELPSGRHALEAGCAVVRVIDDFLRFTAAGDRVVDPQRSVGAQVAATEQALADGFTGIRSIADGTAIARTPQQRDALARFEHELDRRMSSLPAAALCAYDVGELGASVVAELACLHPFVGVRSTPFRLYAEADADARLALAGELDATCRDLLAAAMRRVLDADGVTGADRPLDDRLLDVDARGLAFADHRCLLALDAVAAARGARIALHSAPPIVRRVSNLLGPKHLCFVDEQQSEQA